MSRAIRAVLFDLDGTLLDTAPDLVGALNHVRLHEGLPEVSVEEYGRFASKGARGLLEAGLPGPLEGEIYDARQARFLDHYRHHLYERSRPYVGVPELLEQIEQRAIAWGIVTNKPEYLTFPLMQQVGWAGRAGCVICGDTLPQRKPDPAPVCLAAELLGAAPAETLLVGDDLRDIQAGEAAGMLTALAAYGYGAAEALASGHGLEFQVEKPLQVLALDGLAFAPAPG